MMFKDANGNVIKQTYKADITMWGLNIQLSILLHAVFFVNTDENFYQPGAVIELGKGFVVGNSSLGFLFAMPEFLQMGSSFRAILEAINRQERSESRRDALINALHQRFQEFNKKLLIANLFPSIMYVPFKNVKGGMVMISFGISQSHYLSVVTGGTLTPVQTPA